MLGTQSPATLRARETPVRVGVVGAGEFGTQTVTAVARVPGMTVAAVADSDPERAFEACETAGVDAVGPAADLRGADAEGATVVLGDGAVLATADVDVLVEASGDPDAAARHAYRAVREGTHVVMATVETDAVVGPELAALAADRGVVYSLAYGDQPALIAEQVTWARLAGLDVVAAGRGTGEADSNAAVEMCAAANATGLAPDVPGMHAPAATLSDLPTAFRPEADGGRLSGDAAGGVVDVAVEPAGTDPRDAVTSGVFVVGTGPADARAFFRSKNRTGVHADPAGEYLAFHRPHHVPGGETTVSVAAAVRGETTGVPAAHVGEVTARALADLPAGATLRADPEDEGRIRGILERADAAREAGHVPFSLLDGGTLEREVAAGETIARGDVRLDRETNPFLRALRGVQEGLETGSV